MLDLNLFGLDKDTPAKAYPKLLNLHDLANGARYKPPAIKKPPSETKVTGNTKRAISRWQDVLKGLPTVFTTRQFREHYGEYRGKPLSRRHAYLNVESIERYGLIVKVGQLKGMTENGYQIVNVYMKVNPYEPTDPEVVIQIPRLSGDSE